MNRTLYEDDHEAFRSTVKRFIEKEISPHYEKWESQRHVHRDLFQRAGELGLLGLLVPEKYGGGGAPDFRYNAVFIEELCAAGVLNSGQGLILHSSVVLPYIASLGTEEQCAQWLPKLCSGESIAAIAISEPDVGSDVGAIATRAIADGEHFIVNGSKQFITNGLQADVVIVVCRTGPAESRHRNLSLLLIESDVAGFTCGRNLSKIGQHSVDTAELAFQDMRVPRTSLLGELDRGFYHLMKHLSQERLSIAITATAHAEAAFDWTLEYCKQRKAFGQPIGTFQHNRFVLATMRTELDVARVFVDKQIQAHASGDLTAEEAAGAKWWCTELNKRVLDSCLQLHGGYGYMEDCPIAGAWRDGRAMSIYGGTTEVMKDLIGRRVLGL
jgi:alkylation response protein AidB-like acyl-CoA dehydrogenase